MASQESEQTGILREILKWVRFSGMKEVKTVLEGALDTDQKRTAYQASDGTRATREVATISGYGSKSTIETLWKKWRRLGLGESFQVMGGGERFKRSFDLEDFEIAVSSVPQSASAQQPTRTPVTVEKSDPVQTMEVVGS